MPMWILYLLHVVKKCPLYYQHICPWRISLFLGLKVKVHSQLSICISPQNLQFPIYIFNVPNNFFTSSVSALDIFRSSTFHMTIICIIFTIEFATQGSWLLLLNPCCFRSLHKFMQNINALRVIPSITGGRLLRAINFSLFYCPNFCDKNSNQ